METELENLHRYRRRQRRRAVVGWAGVILLAVAFVGFVLQRGDPHAPRRNFNVPYGEVMTAADFTEIHTGEEAAVVLERLDQTGRPEGTTLPYVLALFPAREEGDFCTYWEFSDKPAIFARLCFSSSNGELVQKLKNNVDNPITGEDQGQMI